MQQIVRDANRLTLIAESRLMKRKSCGWNWKFLLQVSGVNET
jgi:hypothetical protein